VSRLARAAPPLLGLLAAGLFLTLSRDLDQVARPGQLGPGFWPRLALGGLALTCLARLARAVSPAARAPGVGAADPATAADPAAGAAAPGRAAAAVGLILLYVWLAPVVGFALATAAFVAAFMALAGARSAAAIAGAAVGGPVALLYVFVKLVYLPLPKGAGPFETATLALYRALGLF